MRDLPKLVRRCFAIERTGGCKTVDEVVVKGVYVGQVSLPLVEGGLTTAEGLDPPYPQQKLRLVGATLDWLEEEVAQSPPRDR